MSTSIGADKLKAVRWAIYDLLDHMADFYGWEHVDPSGYIAKVAQAAVDDWRCTPPAKREQQQRREGGDK